MKRFLLVLLVLSATLFSGCLKNYKTVSEYSAAMNEVKSNLGDYTIDAVLSNDEQEAIIRSYTKTNNKWKTEISEDNGNTYKTGILYDGAEVLSYDTTSKMAMTIPFLNLLSSKEMGDNEMAASIMKVVNPVGILFNWSFEELGGDVDKDWKFGKVTKKNNYQCRMIHSTDGKNEVCVNDKYGIAVYAKFFNEAKNKTIIINVKNINNASIPDSVLKLPKGIKKKTMEDLFRDMANALRGMSNPRAGAYR